jgi:hypothetical protein
MPGLAATEKFTDPLPLPVVLDVKVIHGALETAVHVQAPVSVKETEPVPPLLGISCELVVKLMEQGPFK